jgi:hypothetical protein
VLKFVRWVSFVDLDPNPRRRDEAIAFCCPQICGALSHVLDLQPVSLHWAVLSADSLLWVDLNGFNRRIQVPHNLKTCIYEGGKRQVARQGEVSSDSIL